ncbi:MAG: transcriptional repressor LexA [Candidatus Methylacidiphilales bacterium]
MTSRHVATAQRILETIRQAIAEDGRPPTIRELQQRLGYRSPRAVSYHLERLEAEGRIVRRGNSRNIQVIDPEVPEGIPCFETIPAGRIDPTSPDAPSGHLPILPEMFGLEADARLFAVRVRGDSMVGEGILDGDWAIFEIRPPRSGDIVAAWMDGGATLKRLVQEQGRVLLRAANPKYPDLVPETELEIQGVLVGITRTIPSPGRATPPVSVATH